MGSECMNTHLTRIYPELTGTRSALYKCYILPHLSNSNEERLAVHNKQSQTFPWFVIFFSSNPVVESRLTGIYGNNPVVESRLTGIYGNILLEN